MPDLPTVTVTSAQADRLLAVFSGQTADDGTELTPQQAYRRWLAEHLKDYVIRAEVQQMWDNHDDVVRDHIAAARADLDI